MPGEPFDVIFKADPSDAVQAAKRVAAETNRIADSDQKRSGILDKISTKLTTIAKTTALAAIAATGFGVKKLADQIDAYEKLSRAIEVSYEKAQELAIAERDAGLEIGSIKSAIEGLAKAQAALSPELRRLGFTIEDIQKSKPDELFDQLSKRLRNGQMSAREFDAAIKVLGRNGADVALALQGGFESFREEARDSGRIISEEAFGKLISSTDTFLSKIKLMSDDIVKAVTPFETFSEAASKALDKVGNTLDKLKAGVRGYVNFYGGLLAGMTPDEAGDFAAQQVAGADDSDKERLRKRLASIESKRSASESLKDEKNIGISELLKRAESRFSKQSDIGALQRVGLAGTAGESASLRLQRDLNGKTQTLINEIRRQSAIIKNQ